MIKIKDKIKKSIEEPIIKYVLIVTDNKEKYELLVIDINYEEGKVISYIPTRVNKEDEKDYYALMNKLIALIKELSNTISKPNAGRFDYKNNKIIKKIKVVCRDLTFIIIDYKKLNKYSILKEEPTTE